MQRRLEGDHHGADVVYVAINRSDAAQSVGGLPAATLTDRLGGGAVTGPAVTVPARRSMVLVRRSD